MFFKKDDFSTALHKEILMFIGTIFSMLQITTGDGWVTDIVRPMNTGEVKKSKKNKQKRLGDGYSSADGHWGGKFF